MKRIILIVAAIVCIIPPSAAQQKWTLRQCIDYAVENNIEIRQTALSVETAEIDLNTSKNSRLPDLSASAALRLGYGLATNYNTGLKENSATLSSDIGISTSIPIFQGMRINNEIKQNKLDMQAAMENLSKAKENLALTVTGYYLDVLLNREILRVYQEQVALTKEQVTRTEELVRSGKVAESQLYDIRSQLATDELNEVNARNNLNLALLNLAQVLNVEWSSSFDIGEPDMDRIVVNNLSGVQSPDYVYHTALGIKPHVREAEYRLQSSEYQVKIAQSAYYPRLSLSASAGDGSFHRLKTQYDTNGDKIEQASFRKQYKEGYSFSVGLNLSIPIFNRNQTRNSVRTARLNVTNYELALENVKLTLYKEIQQASQSAVAAQARYEATGRALEASTEAFRAMQMSYDYGRATVYEYNEIQTRYVSSKSERAQAKYNFLFSAKILDFYAGREIDIDL